MGPGGQQSSGGPQVLVRARLAEATEKARPMRAPRTKGIPLGSGLAWNSLKVLSAMVTTRAEKAGMRGAVMQNHIGKYAAASCTLAGTETWEDTQMAYASDAMVIARKEPKADGMAARGRRRLVGPVNVGRGEAILRTGVAERGLEGEVLIRR